MDEAVVAAPARAGHAHARPTNASLRQRNRLLKEWDGRGAPPGLEAWDEQLVADGRRASIRARARGGRRARAARRARSSQHLAGYGLVVRYAPNVGDRWTGGRRRGRVPGAAGGAARRRAAAADLARRAPPRRPGARRARPRRASVRLARRDLGRRAVPAAGPGAARSSASSASRRSCWWTTRTARSTRAAGTGSAERLAARAGQVVISVADEADVPARRRAVWDVAPGGPSPPREAA